MNSSNDSSVYRETCLPDKIYRRDTAFLSIIIFLSKVMTTSIVFMVLRPQTLPTIYKQ